MSVAEEFQEFRKILCVCPCCGDLVRVSDLRMIVAGAAGTWLDDFDSKDLILSRKEERWEAKEAEIRDASVAKGRKAAEAAFSSALSPAFRSLRINPHDVKPILHPVDYVVFKGLEERDVCNDVVFLSKSVKETSLNTLRNQVKTAIAAKNYEWKVARIDERGKIGFE